MDLVSVVVPAYNSEKLIPITLGSVITQTYPKLEIIVVDDGSADGTARRAEQTLASFAGPWRVLRQENKGVAAARNRGWRAARGPWIQFLDHDDVLTPDKIKLQMAAAQDSPAEIACIYSNWQRAVGEGDDLSPVEDMQTPQVDGKPPASLLMRKNSILLGSALIRREWLETVQGLDEQIPQWEDLELLLRVAAAGGAFRLVPSSEPLMLWRMYPGQARIGGENARYKLTDVATGYFDLVNKAADQGRIERLGLSAEDIEDILGYCTMFLRLLYREDRATFHECLKLLRKLVPGYVPGKPFYLRMIAKSIGYENAEAFASAGRRIKGRLRSLMWNGAPLES